MLDILFRSKYWVSLLIFLNRMARICIGNLMPRKRDYSEWYMRVSCVSHERRVAKQ